MIHRAHEQPNEDAGVHAARERFLRSAHLLKPQVTAELMGKPLEQYRPMFDAFIAGLPADQRVFWWAGRRPQPVAASKRVRVCPAAISRPSM